MTNKQTDPGPDWPAVVAFALAQGQANMAERVATRRWLMQEAGTTLALCLAGMAGALAYAAPLLNGQGATPLVWGAAVASVYLAALSALLVGGCLWVKPVAAQFNEPGILLDPPHDGLVHLHWGEALALQARIERMTRDVRQLAMRLNAIRAAAALLPLVAAVGAWGPWVGPR